jgi:predicted GNAT family acetyltransferase
VSAPEGRPSVVVADAPGEGRFEARIDGQLVGFVTYRRTAGTIAFLHTEVLPGQEGGGVGSALARSVLVDARARGLRVRPLCPFIKAYIRRHPEHADLVGPVPAPGITPSP